MRPTSSRGGALFVAGVRSLAPLHAEPSRPEVRWSFDHGAAGPALVRAMSRRIRSAGARHPPNEHASGPE